METEFRIGMIVVDELYSTRKDALLEYYHD